MRLDALPNASRRIEGFVKANFIKHQGLFQKALQLFEKAMHTPGQSILKEISCFTTLFRINITQNLVYIINLFIFVHIKAGRNASNINFPLFRATGGL